MNLLHHKTDIAIIGAIIGMLVIGGVLVVPALRDIVALKNEISAQRKKLEQQRASGHTLAKTIADYERIKDDVPVLGEAMLSLGHELDFITDMEKLAAEHSLDLTLAFDTDTADKTKKSPYPVATSFSLEGRYLPLLAFLNRIERLPYYVSISTIRMSPVKVRVSSSQFNIPQAPDSASVEAAPDNTLKADISATTYWK